MIGAAVAAASFVGFACPRPLARWFPDRETIPPATIPDASPPPTQRPCPCCGRHGKWCRGYEHRRDTQHRRAFVVPFERVWH